MNCSRSIYLEDFKMRVPCGKCVACRIDRAREWATRIVHETGYHDSNVFITLTYDDNNKPLDDSINKSEVQRFIKRLRKGLDKKIKYYACGEYGERFQRPHYHLIVFGLGVKDKKYITNCWKKGFVYCGTVTYDSARYVADYVQKKYLRNYYNGKVKPFQLCSQGLGLRFAINNSKQLKEQLYCTIRGVKVGLPRYYQKKLEVPTEEKYLKGLERREEILKGRIERGIREEDVFKDVQASRNQSERNLNARRALKRKKL